MNCICLIRHILPSKSYKFYKISIIVSSEAVAKTGMIMVVGEISSTAHIDYQKVIRDTIKHIGYDDAEKGI